MWPMKLFARTAHERRWYGRADTIYQIARRTRLPRRLWYPVWRWCCQQGYTVPAAPLPVLRLPEPVELEAREVGR